MHTRVLLTGGAGFIGSAVARQLLQAGYEVTVLDKLTYAGNRANLDGLALDLVVGDVCDRTLVDRLLVSVDAVVHAAAESHVERALVNPEPFLRTNIRGTLTLLEAAIRARVPRFLHVSTDEVFGEIPVRGSFGPHDPLRPGNVYAATKASAEAFVHYARHTHGYPATLVRCTNNYGPRQHVEKAIPGWIRAALAGLPLTIHGDGQARRDWLHVDDFARGVVALLGHSQAGGAWHFSGRHIITNLEVARAVVRACASGTRSDPKPDIEPDIKPDMGNEIVHVAERKGQDRRYALDDEATRRALDWEPRIPFSRGLARTVEWYRGALASGAFAESAPPG